VTGVATTTPGCAVTGNSVTCREGALVGGGAFAVQTVAAAATAVASSPAGCSAPDSAVECAQEALAVGGTFVIGITGLAPTAAGSVVNSATVTGDDPDPVPANDTNGVTTAVTPAADLSIVKSGPASVATGGSMAWTLTVANNGPDDSTGFTVSDDVPVEVTDVATTTEGCSVSDNAVTCTEGRLAVGDIFVVEITGTAPTTPGSVVNTATVTGDDPDPDPGNGTTGETTTVATTNPPPPGPPGPPSHGPAPAPPGHGPLPVAVPAGRAATYGPHGNDAGGLAELLVPLLAGMGVALLAGAALTIPGRRRRRAGGA
jgi:hypothetical protein